MPDYYKKKMEENEVEAIDMLRAEDELVRAKYEAGLLKEGKATRFMNKIFDNVANKVPVKKKTYIILLLLTGWFGGHRFYAKKWVPGLIYLALCWLFIGVSMSIVDLMIVLPMKADENGMIMI